MKRWKKKSPWHWQYPLIHWNKYYCNFLLPLLVVPFFDDVPPLVLWHVLCTDDVHVVVYLIVLPSLPAQ